MTKKFDAKKLDKLNDPRRLKFQSPDLIWDRLNLQSPRVLVEIGAGTGFFALPFSKKMNGGRLYACDVSSEMIAWMEKNIALNHREAIVPLEMVENKVPLPGGIADLVYMINVHHELEAPAVLLAEAGRLLKAGGKLAIIDWKKEEAPVGPRASRRVSEEVVRKQVLAAGFSNLDLADVLPYHYFLIAAKGDNGK